MMKITDKMENYGYTLGNPRLPLDLAGSQTLYNVRAYVREVNS